MCTGRRGQQHYNEFIEGDSFKRGEEDFSGDCIEIPDDMDFIDINNTGWFQELILLPEKAVEIHRRILKLTQAELGLKFAGKSQQFISDIN